MQGQKEFDQLVQEMDLSLSVDSTTAAVVKEDVNHPRLSLYKNRGRALDQEKRWWQSLRMHRSKANRDTTFDRNRGMLSPSSTQASVESKKRSGRKNPWVSKSTDYVGSSWRSYSNHLMLAEWLLFFPPSFFESYVFKLCPKGRQVFVRAQKVSRFSYLHLSLVNLSFISQAGLHLLVLVEVVVLSSP
ncbi:Snurportin-1 [Fasciola gigantica]|uniref:Snurportin-1 n=1 Tax=Fasciola gigantica TaxID=46835 RepID=A0A504Y410_FASGI|nr:Snurportin-1 [Fasciola gigantica]